MEIVGALVLGGIVVLLLTRSRARLKEAQTSTEQGQTVGSYRIVQVPDISNEQLAYACRLSIDLLHNSIVHDRKIDNAFKFSISRGSHFSDAEIEMIESYLVGAFCTVIDQICTTQEVRVNESTKATAYTDLARHLLEDKPGLYLLSSMVERPATPESIGNRLRNEPKESKAFALGQRNAKELIKHLSESGPTPDTSLLQALMKVTTVLHRP